jgi:hypothetical protein
VNQDLTQFSFFWINKEPLASSQNAGQLNPEMTPVLFIFAANGTKKATPFR